MFKIKAALLAAAALAGCAYNEQLGRSQLLLVNDQDLAAAGEQAWAEAVRTSRIARDARANARVRQAGGRLVQAAGLADRPWEYVVFENPQANAFVLPGGRIGVNTGLLQLVENDDQLAAVIGHEIAHATANHAAERYSTQAAAQVALSGAQSALGRGGSELGQRVAAFGGLGAQLGVLLPFSRRHELEADRLGLEYMARAGYRPSQALRLWQLMAQNRSSRTPEFLSTHPSDASRLAALEAELRTRGWL